MPVLYRLDRKSFETAFVHLPRVLTNNCGQKMFCLYRLLPFYPSGFEGHPQKWLWGRLRHISIYQISGYCSSRALIGYSKSELVSACYPPLGIALDFTSEFLFTFQKKTPRYLLLLDTQLFLGCDGVFVSEFKAWSLPSCCFLIQET